MRRQPLSSRSSDKLRCLLEKPLLFRSPEGRAFSRIRECREPRVSGRWCEVTVKEETPGPMRRWFGSLTRLLRVGRGDVRRSGLGFSDAQGSDDGRETCEDENWRL